MNQNALNYLQQNKDKYSKEQLIDQLKKAGYSEADINESIASVYTQKGNFWNFKVKKVYRSSNEKLGDFAFGCLGIIVINFISGILILSIVLLTHSSRMEYLSLVSTGIYLIILFFLFNRRRYIFYGMLLPFICLSVISLILLASGVLHIK